MTLHLLHPALVHFPIAFLIAASLAGLFYLHWQRRSELYIIYWAALLAGWPALLIAIISGIVSQGALPPDAPYRGVLNWHTTSGLALAALYGDLIYRGWLHTNRQKKLEEGKRIDFLSTPGRRWLLSAELILGLALVIVSGYLGGTLVYDWGIGVTAP